MSSSIMSFLSDNLYGFDNYWGEPFKTGRPLGELFYQMNYDFRWLPIMMSYFLLLVSLFSLFIFNKNLSLSLFLTLSLCLSLSLTFSFSLSLSSPHIHSNADVQTRKHNTQAQTCAYTHKTKIPTYNIQIHIEQKYTKHIHKYTCIFSFR